MYEYQTMGLGTGQIVTSASGLLRMAQAFRTMQAPPPPPSVAPNGAQQPVPSDEEDEPAPLVDEPFRLEGTGTTWWLYAGLGGVVLGALGGGGYWWWRRRQRSRATASEEA